MIVASTFARSIGPFRSALPGHLERHFVEVDYSPEDHSDDFMQDGRNENVDKGRHVQFSSMIAETAEASLARWMLEKPQTPATQHSELRYASRATCRNLSRNDAFPNEVWKDGGISR